MGRTSVRARGRAESLETAAGLCIIDARAELGGGMYSSSAFKILGIDPTNDGRAIRAAYVRLARIFHPDRFVGMPDDVRLEAERRMKEATAAYEALRALKRTSGNGSDESEVPTLRNDLWERAKRARDTVEAIRVEQQRNRTRWLLWEELERQARDRAEWEARMAAQLADDSPRVRDIRPEQRSDEEKRSASSLGRRLEAAKEHKRDALAPAQNDTA
jgi:curved DNA-binding protein CbpA